VYFGRNRARPAASRAEPTSPRLATLDGRSSRGAAKRPPRRCSDREGIDRKTPAFYIPRHNFRNPKAVIFTSSQPCVKRLIFVSP